MKIKVRAVASFEGVRIGDIAELEMTPRLQGILDRGYLVEVCDGSVRDGHSSDTSGISSGSSTGTEDRGTPGSEQGEDPVPGGHGETSQ